MILKIVAHSNYVKHLTGPGHPETPARYEAIINGLKEAGILTPQNTITPLPATFEDILLCHTPNYIDRLVREVEMTKSTGASNGEWTLSTGDVQICPDSLNVALLAVGGVLAGIDAVMNNECKHAFCCVRPPGHHATSDQGMGFCLFNNVAIGARYLQKKFGLTRILIVDWDVHHGNGTQEIFYDDSSVFYFSTHQKGIYPGTGFEEEKGMGNILNCPIIGGPGSRLLVLEAFQTKLVTAMEKFQPQFVLISAGFDGHYADPLGGFDLTEADFAKLIQIVHEISKKYATGNVVAVLEGGYNLKSLMSASISTFSELLKLN